MKQKAIQKMNQWNHQMARGSRLQQVRHDRRIREIRRGDPTGRVRRYLFKTGAVIAVIVGVILGLSAIGIDLLFR